MEKKIIVPICVIVLMLMFSGISVNATKTVNKIDFNNSSMPLKSKDCPINITAQEARDLLMDTGNGIQIPIDVRHDNEWNEGYIDTPFPECPVWYTKDLIETPDGLQAFLDTYNGEEIIVYCGSGYRSLIVSYIICDAGFTGTVYNMLGGMNGWLAEGYPIRNNTQPDAPTIDGPAKGGANVVLEYTLSTADAEGDGVSYIIDWGDNTTTETGLYAIDVEGVANHTYEAKGTYNIQAKAKDFYGNESDPTNFEVKIPRTRANNFNLWNWLFERFPILRQLLGL